MISGQMLPEMTAEVGCIFSTELYDDTDRLLSTLQILEKVRLLMINRKRMYIEFTIVLGLFTGTV